MHSWPWNASHIQTSEYRWLWRCRTLTLTLRLRLQRSVGKAKGRGHGGWGRGSACHSFKQFHSLPHLTEFWQLCYSCFIQSHGKQRVVNIVLLLFPQWTCKKEARRVSGLKNKSGKGQVEDTAAVWNGRVVCLTSHEFRWCITLWNPQQTDLHKQFQKQMIIS